MKSLDRMIASESQSSTGSTSTSGWQGNEIPYEPSFEVEQVGDIRAVDSGWLDDDVEEVMVVKKKKRKPLSVIIEATEGIHLSPTKPRVAVVGTVNASDFEYIRTLKVAQYGESLIARKPDTGTVHTVKLVRKSGHSASELARRVAAEQKIMRVLTECSVPFAARLHWSFEDDRAMYLVIDRTDGSNLRGVVETQGPLLPHDAVLCAAELIEGISGMHALGIVHTSLRPESIFVGEDGHVFISDFDDAVFLQDDVERQETTCGTPRTTTSPEYQAPEMVLEWEYDYAVDWWSFGLVLFWTLTGTHPFTHVGDADHPSIIRSKVLHSRLTGDRLGMDEDAYQLISRCLQRNPALRIDGVGVKMHAYFQGMSVVHCEHALVSVTLLTPFRSDWKDVAAKQIEGNA
ncbi:kinase-like domain-containing protein [Lenzites betulinus]|nr:kinase-like domain-containing protein [Lenzites betulinus]